MTGQFRGARGVQKLLSIAAADAAIMRADFGDMTRVYELTRAEIDNLDAASGAAADNDFGDGLGERRFNLKKTLSAVEAVRDDAYARLSKALSEIAKLERLSEINRREACTFREGAAPDAAPAGAPPSAATSPAASNLPRR